MIQSVRGFRDILPPESDRLRALEDISRDVLRRYGYREVRLPILEPEELYRRSTGETTDIVEKEMFWLQDSGGRRLALRPEATPGMVRAYLENHLHQKLGGAKLFTIGSMFRAERPQAGRFREFEQVNVESLGSAHPSVDAELVCALKEILAEAGLADFTIELNSLGCSGCRPRYRESLLLFLKARSDSLCPECRRRIEKNPLRALDCKQDGPGLSLCVPERRLCADCQNHFAQVQEFLTQSRTAFEVRPALVRGLDYYTRTVFEFRSPHLGAQDAVAAGGRYDDLVEQLGGPATPAVGWALGAERSLQAIEKQGEGSWCGMPQHGGIRVLVAAQGEKNQVQAFVALQQLRHLGISATAEFDKSLKAQMRQANQLGCREVVIVGEEEVQKNFLSVKDLSSGEQKAVPFSEIASIFSAPK